MIPHYKCVELNANNYFILSILKNPIDIRSIGFLFIFKRRMKNKTDKIRTSIMMKKPKSLIVVKT